MRRLVSIEISIASSEASPYLSSSTARRREARRRPRVDVDASSAAAVPTSPMSSARRSRTCRRTSSSRSGSRSAVMVTDVASRGRGSRSPARSADRARSSSVSDSSSAKLRISHGSGTNAPPGSLTPSSLPSSASRSRPSSIRILPRCSEYRGCVAAASHTRRSTCTWPAVAARARPSASSTAHSHSSGSADAAGATTGSSQTHAPRMSVEPASKRSERSITTRLTLAFASRCIASISRWYVDANAAFVGPAKRAANSRLACGGANLPHGRLSKRHPSRSMINRPLRSTSKPAAAVAGAIRACSMAATAFAGTGTGSTKLPRCCSRNMAGAPQ